MKIHIGGTLEGIYWTSGVVDNLIKNNIDLEIYATGASSLIAVFYSIYNKNFFAKLKAFINDKDNPLQNLMNTSDMYKNRYSQATTLFKIGRSKDALYKHDELREFFEDNFNELKISDMDENINFELFNVTKESPEWASKDTKIVDMLLAQFSYPPFYKYYVINEEKYIPTSYVSFIPWKNIENSIIINFDMKIDYPVPNNGLEILLNASHNRTKKLFTLLTNNNTVLLPENISKEPFMINCFFKGQKESEIILEDKNE
ncbi:MAG: patatin-like phospholipase family protein [Thermotogota bacterium]